MTLAIRLWATPLGQHICRVITGGKHVWKGWKHAGEVAGQPLPMAYCARCSREF